MKPNAPESDGIARQALSQIAVALILLGCGGLFIARQLAHPGVMNLAAGTNTFFEQFRQHEPVFVALMAAFAIVVAIFARRAAPNVGINRTALDRTDSWNSWWIVVVCSIVFGAAAAGTSRVMHALPLSMDEYVASFQARAFASGRVFVPLPDEWRQFGKALAPVFVAYDPDANSWLSGYWPIYSLIRALFLRVGADRLLNPMLAAISVPLIYACARKLWPQDRQRAWIATAFLALSSQFMFMSMTGYAMPAHLVMSLLWLYAYARGDRKGWLAAPIIGVIALGLHNPLPHALFAAPFLLHLLLSKRWKWVVYFGSVYLIGIVVWYAWAQAVTVATMGGTLAAFATPSLRMLGVQEMSLTVVLSWQTPVLAVLLLSMALSWRSLSDMEQCLMLGVVLSLGFFLFYPGTQGHGWGYRYTYAVLGNIALLGAAGFDRLRNALGALAARQLLVASAALTVLVQFPLRAWQIEHYVRPFAQAQSYVSRIDADVVIIDPTTSWYGIDLVRNDPFLQNTPKVISAFYLKPQDKRALASRFGDRVHLLTPQEVGQFGIPTFPSKSKRPIWPPS